MKGIVVAILTIVSLDCGGKKQNDSAAAKMETVNINLPSMVCGNCAKTIRKAIYGVEGVKDVNVDVEKKVAEVKFVSLQTNIQAIEEAVTEAGYDADNRKRNPEAYEKLEKCCKIDG